MNSSEPVLELDDEIDVQISPDNIEELQAAAPLDAEEDGKVMNSRTDGASSLKVPLAEDELSDIEDSRRGSGHDALLPGDLNIAVSVRDRLAFLNTDISDHDSAEDSGSESENELERTLQRQASVSSASAEGDRDALDAAENDLENGAGKLELEPDLSASLTPQEEVRLAIACEASVSRR